MFSQKLAMLKSYSQSFWSNRVELFWAAKTIEFITLICFMVYMMGKLNFADKFMAFAISGKIPGASYELKLRDVGFIAAILFGLALLFAVRAIFKKYKASRAKPVQELSSKREGAKSLKLNTKNA